MIDQLMDHEVPYLSFPGASRCCTRSFSRWSSAFARAAANARSKPMALSDARGCERLKGLGVKAVQVSLDGASSATFGRMRVRGQFDRTLAGVRNLRAARRPNRDQLLAGQFQRS